MKELQQKILNLTIRLKKEYRIPEKKSRIFYDIFSYLGEYLNYRTFEELEHNAYYHIIEKYKCNKT